MREFKCDTRSQGNFLYRKNPSVFTVCTDRIIIVRIGCEGIAPGVHDRWELQRTFETNS
jgi:hypothetical protein